MFPCGRSGGSKARKQFRPRRACTWLRERLSWRSDRLSRSFPTNYAPNRDGMSRRRDRKRRDWLFQWFRNAITAVLISTCIGCRHDPQPDALYEQIDREFAAGELSKANELSRNAYIRFESTRPDWSAAFRLELAKILIYQGKSADALELLEQPLPSGSRIHSEARQKILLSIAYARVGHLDQAEQALVDAERLHPEGQLRAEVATARGTVDMDKGDLDDAERQFQASLTEARHNEDRFLQTQSLVNLGHVALAEEHYEDALARFSNASVMAQSIGAKLAQEKIGANLGWVYYKLGDFTQSLTYSIKAEKQAS